MSGPITTPSQRRIPRTCRAMIAASFAIQATGVAVAQSEPATKEATISVSIAAGPLDRSLRQYAEVAGFQLVYAPELVSGLRSRALSGSFAPRQGLELLLTGTGLTYRFVSDRTVTLERTTK